MPKIIGYKTAGDCLVVLCIPKDAKTNVKRNNVTYMETAKFRCNKAKVLAIINWKTGKFKKKVKSNRSHKFRYKIGKTMVEPKYCINKNDVCAEGIHFFLSVLGAYALYSLNYNVSEGGKLGITYTFTTKDHEGVKLLLEEDMMKLPNPMTNI